jgi:hypothetical protein
VTLVISVLSQDCVWQVADRRLTDFVTGRVVSRDANKAILFARSMLFAFTGPARLGGRATADWIAEQLSSDPDPDRALSRLPDALNDALRRLRRPRDLRALALDGVGWALDRQTGMVGPRLIRMSNCIDANGVWTGRLDDPVTVFDGMLKQGVLLNMRAAGQPVPLAVGRSWERVVRRRIASNAPPSDVGQCLVQFVRDVAERNRAVGPGVLLSAIPRAAVLEPSGMTIAAMPDAISATFKYFPEGSAEGIDKGPEVVGLGGSRMKDFLAHTAPDGTQTVQVSFRIPGPPRR